MSEDGFRVRTNTQEARLREVETPGQGRVHSVDSFLVEHKDNRRANTRLHYTLTENSYTVEATFAKHLLLNVTTTTTKRSDWTGNKNAFPTIRNWW